MFSSRLPPQALVELCRALRHQMEAGLTLAQAMKQQAKGGPLLVRPVAHRIAEKLKKGHALKDALEGEQAYFPPLFLALSGVAEDTGMLPEVLRELEAYFEMQVRLRRQFRSQISWPVFQFVGAILVIALLIWIRGFLPGMADFTGLNLKGSSGALTFLAAVGMFIGLLVGGYLFMKYALQKGPLVDGFLLKIPVLGRCLEAFALARFAMGLHLTQEAGTPMNEALRLSLNATNNAAFAHSHERIARSVEAGNELSFALREAHLFPDDFLQILETAEISGQIPEVMRKQAVHYHEEASRRLAFLTVVAARLVYVLVGVFIVVAIFRIYSSAFQQQSDLIRQLQ